MAAPPEFERVILDTRSVARVVPDGVFDAFAWSASSTLEWQRPIAWDATTQLSPDLPERLLFVFREDVDWLPRELAHYHAPKFGFTTEMILAPYAIDDATDLLYERRTSAASLMYLATDNLNALFWALHDWSHFHHHGPFEERAWTEFQCDLSALLWMHDNRERISLSTSQWSRLLEEVGVITRKRFQEEGKEAPSVTREAVFALATPRAFL